MEVNLNDIVVNSSEKTKENSENMVNNVVNNVDGENSTTISSSSSSNSSAISNNTSSYSSSSSSSKKKINKKKPENKKYKRKVKHNIKKDKINNIDKNIKINPEKSIDDLSMYEKATRLRLAHRLILRRDRIVSSIERLILYVHEKNQKKNDMLLFLKSTSEQDVLTSEIVNMILKRREMRLDKNFYDVLVENSVLEMAKKFSIEKLNNLLFYLDNLFKDVSRTIEAVFKDGLSGRLSINGSLEILLKCYRTLIKI